MDIACKIGQKVQWNSSRQAQSPNNSIEHRRKGSGTRGENSIQLDQRVNDHGSNRVICAIVIINQSHAAHYCHCDPAYRWKAAQQKKKKNSENSVGVGVDQPPIVSHSR